VAAPARPRAAPWRRLLRDRRGSVLPVAALGFLATLGASALALDLTRAYAARNELRTAADAAALAAAARLPDIDAARRAALAYAARNATAGDDGGAVVEPDDVEFGAWDPRERTLTPAAAAPDSVRVTARLAGGRGNALPTFLARLFGTDTVDLSATAVAGRSAAACVVVLDPSSATAMLLDSNAGVTARGCAVQVNSVGDAALRVASNGSLAADAICVGGGYAGGAGAVTPTPVRGCPPVPDPLAGLPPPEVGACDRPAPARYVDSKATLRPGVYCAGLEIDGNSDVKLEPGTYVIKDGAFRVLSNAKLRGDGVTFYLTGREALLQFDSNAKLKLSAPTSGPMAGVLFFQDRAFGGVHRWNSTSPFKLTGTIYLPQATLVSASPSRMTPLSSCNVVIVRWLGFTSDSGVSIDLTGAGCREALPSAVLGSVVLRE
jgi:hypothetical protein